MRRIVRIATIAGVATAAALTALPASGSAGTYTKVLSPKGPGQSVYTFYDGNTPPTMSVTGQASNDVVKVNLYCFSQDDQWLIGPLNSAPIAVSTSTTPHTFTASGVAQPFPPSPCTLRAVPDTFTFPNAPRNSSYVGSFAGPAFYPADHLQSPAPNLNTIVSAANPQAAFQLNAPDAGGLMYDFPVDSFHQSSGWGVFTLGLQLTQSNLTLSSGTSTHSQIKVDGANVYLPYTLRNYAAPSAVPHERLSMTRSATTGNLSGVDTLPLRTCGSTYPPSNPCTPTDPGVVLKRTITSTAGGAVLSIRDAFISTDHASHRINAEYGTEIQDLGQGQVGVKLPGGLWRRPPVNKTYTTLPAGPHTIFATNDLDATEGTPSRNTAGLTYSGKPVVYFNDTNVLAMRYTRAAKQDRPARFGFAFETAWTQRTATSLASAQQKALTPHLAVTAPAKTTSDNTPTWRGRVTNATNGLPTKVTVTVGTKSKTVAVHDDGRFTVTWTTLTNGKHTAKAKATDPSGYVLRATRTVTIT